MDAEDLKALKEAIKLVVDPLKETVDNLSAKVDKLPCGEHDTRVVVIETEHKMEKELKHDKGVSKDLLFKFILVIVGIGGLLQTIGFFRSLGN